MIKKELFNRLIDEFKLLPHSSYKATWTEDIELHCFGYEYNRDLSEAKELFKQHGWKHTQELYTAFSILSSTRKTVKTYLTVLYDTAKDKISISAFETGYAYSYRKQRFYPLRKNTPLFCWSKHMYMFTTTVNGKSVPRIQLGTINLPSFSEYGKKATEVFMNAKGDGNGNGNFGISYRYHMNTKTPFDVIENYTGVKVPKILKNCCIPYQVVDLYRALKDYNEVNKICQYIAKNSKELEYYMIQDKIDLNVLLSKMLFDHAQYNWLVADSIGDCKALKERTLSLKVTSLKRWQEEHQRKTRLRMLKGVKNIKTHDVYKDALKDFAYEYELIDNKERLIQESVEMSHCVATYAERINNGYCGIFSIMYEGSRYTLEVVLSTFSNGKKELSYNQLKGKFNSAPPEGLVEAVRNVLKPQLFSL